MGWGRGFGGEGERGLMGWMVVMVMVMLTGGVLGG